MTPRQSVCADLLKRFPDTPTKTLARMARRDNPSLFRDVEDARGALRTLRGANGKRSDECAIKSFRQPPRSPGDPFSAIPDGKRHFDSWGALDVAGPLGVLVLSDLHIPYHDKTPIVSALKYGRDRNPSLILLNGDVADFFSVSFWEKDPRKRDLKKEIDIVRDFYSALRSAFPKARIIAKDGNHEERWERYLSVKAPELLGVEDFALQSILRYSNNGIERVSERRPIRLGKVNVIHGHEYRFNISNPVNPARGFFLRAKVHVIGSHLHQSSSHSEKNLDGSVVSAWSIGCLCDLNPDYSPLNNWNSGFAFVDVDKQGAFQVDNLRVIHGKVY